MYFTPHQILFGWSNQEEWDGQGRQHVWRERRGTHMALLGKPEGRDHLDDPGVEGNIMLKLIYNKWDEANGLDWSGSGYGQMPGFCECDNEPPLSIKCGQFLG